MTLRSSSQWRSRSIAALVFATLGFTLAPLITLSLTDPAIAAKPSPWSAQKVQPKSNAWKPYSSKQGRFSVVMPGDTKVISTPVNLGTGDKSKLWGVLSAEAATRTLYISAYMDLPASIDPKSKMAQDSLDQGIDGLIDGQGYDVISRTRFALKGYPGQEIRYQLKNGHTGRCRVFLVKARLYFLIVESEQDAPEQKNVDRFMQSFKLL
jgi:hypothetical protein